MTPLEQQLTAAARRPETFAASVHSGQTQQQQVDQQIQENLLMIHTELDSPTPTRLARVLRWFRVPDLTVPLVTATPSLRRSWFVAVAIAVLFALSVASNDTGVGVERIDIFLSIAPLVPLLGVALAFGKGVDPTHELVVAAPRDSFVVFLIRSLTVLGASSLVLLVSSVLLPAGGLYRVAWLLPAAALSALTLAVSARFDPRRVAAAVAVGWILLVLVVIGATSTAAMFGVPTQIASVLVVAAAASMAIRQRGHYDIGEVQ